MSSPLVFRIRSDPFPLGYPGPFKDFTSPGPAYSSEYHVSKLKITGISRTYVYFFPLAISCLHLPYENFFISIVVF
jgi:hypothetical protein